MKCVWIWLHPDRDISLAQQLGWIWFHTKKERKTHMHCMLVQSRARVPNGDIRVKAIWIESTFLVDLNVALLSIMMLIVGLDRRLIIVRLCPWYRTMLHTACRENKLFAISLLANTFLGISWCLELRNILICKIQCLWAGFTHLHYHNASAGSLVAHAVIVCVSNL